MRRRSFRLVAGALVLAAPLLTSCGFGKATDKVYTPAAGTNERTQDIKVLSAVVVSAQADSGTFIATFSNSADSLDAVTFDGLEGAGEWTDLQVGDVEQADIPARGYVNLADDGGVPIDGDFFPGDFMQLTMTFGNGQSTTMGVPVVYACDEWSGLDTSASAPLAPSASSSASESVSPGDVPTDGTSESADPGDEETPIEPEGSSSASPSASATAQPYDCNSVLEEQ
ncbi:hypothetical protein G5V58_18905 [Nocardioides anomalus]|uniref:DUF4352 domain-containing protein n=1 Tax=Nocardioides anomalus TaxID=2712223 RepID=A0A6G6WGX2_9ACTN|nr:hypothetical protein [Nocardioides anomalus]QIG44578.1 hypothetical protein G5V58_18905 [Nocardioides anomalus]